MAQFDISSSDPELSRLSSTVIVQYYDDLLEEYWALPNVRAVSVNQHEMDQPGSARFRYEFDPLFTSKGDPKRTEDVFGLNATGPHIVDEDDRLVVRVFEEADPYSDPDEPAPSLVYFDGFAVAPQANLGGEQETVTFEAMGVAVRMWDTPIQTSFYRDGAYANWIDTTTASVIETEYEPVFNPIIDDVALPNKINQAIEVNAVAEDADPNAPDDSYPVFMDYNLGTLKDAENLGYPLREYWTLGPAVRYLLKSGEPSIWVDAPPNRLAVDGILESWEPEAGPGAAFDPNDASTYTKNPIRVGHLDITGDVVPSAIRKVIEPHGFAFNFDLFTDDDDNPKTSIGFYRKDSGLPLKSLLLQQAGGGDAGPLPEYDPSQSNLDSLTISRDGSVINAFSVVSGLTRIECSVVLAPLFQTNPTDVNEANLHKWVAGDPSFDPVTYRLFGFDETCEGHTVAVFNNANPNIATVAYHTSPDPLSPWIIQLHQLLGETWDTTKSPPVLTNEQTVVNRRRPARGTLLNKDVKGNIVYAQLYISTDWRVTADGVKYQYPAVWDGTGTWQIVSPRAWQMCDDRLGVILTCEDMSEWHIGEVKIDFSQLDDPDATPAFAGSSVNVVKCLATPNSDDGSTYFSLRLVAVIEGDFGPQAVAPKRDASPSAYTVKRVDELRERYAKELIHFSSPNFVAPEDEDPEKPVIYNTVRDDTADALAHAENRRRAHELYSIGGTARIPGLSLAYDIGDSISGVRGRGIKFQQNAANVEGEGDVYPTVVGRAFVFEPEQYTMLEFTDHRAEPEAERRN